MKRAHYASVRAVHSGAWIIGLAVVWMASAPRLALGQSAWPSYPNNTAISVTSGGNVGIGTPSPAATLHVRGSMQLDGNGGPTSFSLNSGATHRGDLGIAEGPGQYAWGAAAGDIVLRTVSGKILVDTNNGATPPALTIMGGNGNVGIGTADPQYKLAVNGTIGAQDIIVTNAGWSDYVFRPGYRLRPLSEVGAYIRAHRHLPDIPSEAEVNAQGVSVGEMQAKLLAKIEELTLHMIQQDKENRELRERVAQLESRAAASGAPAGGR